MPEPTTSRKLIVPNASIPTEIYVSYGGKMSKDYQSADCTVSVKLTLGEGEIVETVAGFWHDRLKTFVHEKLRQDIKEVCGG